MSCMWLVSAAWSSRQSSFISRASRTFFSIAMCSRLVRSHSNVYSRFFASASTRSSSRLFISLRNLLMCACSCCSSSGMHSRLSLDRFSSFCRYFSRSSTSRCTSLNLFFLYSKCLDILARSSFCMSAPVSAYSFFTVFKSFMRTARSFFTFLSSRFSSSSSVSSTSSNMRGLSIPLLLPPALPVVLGRGLAVFKVGRPVRLCVPCLASSDFIVFMLGRES
mmetsp:Transcript_33462/g.59871  ORF Transcript_33462/g.59871 Transcript_33462/m.59871 type:complete len:221 (+) Transcript_33462:400-1062(+)